MKNLEFSEKEMTYLLISLKHYERKLRSDENEDMEDAATDLLFIESLIAKIKEAKASR
jgi:hypothetical protein